MRKYIFIFFVITLFLRGSSWLLPLQRDAIGYAYNGREIANGAVLYRDMWDHKPPGIYFFNAAVYALSRQAFIPNLRIASFLSSFFSAVLLFYLLRQFFSEKTAGMATGLYAIFSNVYFLSVGDNLVEGYMLPILLSAYYLFVKKRYLLTGIFLGILFLFKQVGILPLAGLGLYLVVEKKREAFIPIMLTGAGIVVALTPFFVYVLRHNILIETWDAVYQYNVLYSRQAVSISSLGQSFYYVVQVILASLLFWTLGAAGLVHRKYTRIDILFLLLLLSSFVGIAMGGRFAFTRHYFLLIFPSLSYFVAKTLDALVVIPKTKFLKTFSILSAAAIFFPSAIMQGQVILSGLYYSEAIDFGKKEMQYLLGLPQYNFIEEQKTYRQIVAYLRRYVSPGDRILDWGAEPELYMFTDTVPPTRYYYNFPLNGVFIKSDPMFAERRKIFMKEIEENKPIFVIANDTEVKHQPGFDSLDFPEFKNFLHQYYRRETTIGNFIIFRL